MYPHGFNGPNRHLNYADPDGAGTHWTIGRRDDFSMYRRDVRELLRVTTRRCGERTQAAFIEGACAGVLERLAGGSERDLHEAESMLHATSAICSRAGDFSSPDAIRSIGSAILALARVGDGLPPPLLCTGAVVIGAAAPQLLSRAGVACEELLAACAAVVERSFGLPEIGDPYPMRTKRDATEHAGAVALLKLSNAAYDARRAGALPDELTLCWVALVRDRLLPAAERQLGAGCVGERSFGLALKAFASACQMMPEAEAIAALEPVVAALFDAAQPLAATAPPEAAALNAVLALRRLCVLFAQVAQRDRQGSGDGAAGGAPRAKVVAVRLLERHWPRLKAVMLRRSAAVPVCQASALLLRRVCEASLLAARAGGSGAPAPAPADADTDNVVEVALSSAEAALAEPAVGPSWWHDEGRGAADAALKSAERAQLCDLGALAAREVFGPEDASDNSSGATDTIGSRAAECYLGLVAGVSGCYVLGCGLGPFVAAFGGRHGAFAAAALERMAAVALMDGASSLDDVEPGAAAAAMAIASDACCRYLVATDAPLLRRLVGAVLAALSRGSQERLVASSALRFFRAIFQGIREHAEPAALLLGDAVREEQLGERDRATAAALEEVGPRIVACLFCCGNGLMPSYMLDDLVLTIGAALRACGVHALNRWAVAALSDETVPRPGVKASTKKQFVERLYAAAAPVVSAERVKSLAKIKRVFKAFCGGKKQGDNRSQEKQTHNARPYLFKETI